MTIPTILVYVSILGYLAIERSLRKGDAALSLKAETSDRGSSKILLLSGLLNLLLLLVVPILNGKGIGNWHLGWICWLGVVLMLLGLSLRYWAAVVLGEFYTRTLKVVAEQRVITQAPYRLIRHPGYAGLLLMELGAVLALDNWLVAIAVLFLGLGSRLHRIRVEEKMLETSMPEAYRAYQDKTWKLIPFVY